MFLFVILKVLGIFLAGVACTEDVDTAPELGRITYGKNAGPEEFPSIVLLTNRRTYCGGTLIDPYWVLTAAHCFENTFMLFASVGKYNFRNKTSGQWFKTSLVLRHPEYNMKTKENDIALVRLSAPATSSTLRFATNTSGDFTGEKCTIAGWGRQHYLLPFTGDKLQKYSSEIISANRCESYYRGLFRPTHVCISGPGTACKGDSGGPLICDDTLVGVTSFGKRFCSLYPTVYTRVSKYYSWILEAMEENANTKV